MELVRYHTQQGYRMAVLVKEGRKLLHMLLMGDNHLTRVPKSESRYMEDRGEPSKGQVRRFNKMARKMGYSKRKPILEA